MRRMPYSRQPYIYVRLSKEDLSDGAEPVELKLEKRKLIAHGLAAQHGQAVPEENIFVEVVSAKTIERRDRFRQVLELAKAGRVSYLFTPYFDRLLRGSKRDEADAEDSLKDGEVVVVSTEGTFDFGDPNFDASQGLAFTVRNAVSRQYLYDLSKKLKETNLIRTKNGQRSAGFAPYGYEWVRPVYRNKKLVESGRYETVPEEYAVLTEICRRIWTDGARSISADLNKRYRALSHPKPPSVHNRLGWSHSTIFAMMKNPFYCGYPAHRFVNRRNGRKTLDRDQWVMPNERQEYECPFSLAEWERLQHHLTSRKRVGTPKTGKQSFLTGILTCANGRFMTNRVRYYACTCRDYATMHKGMAISEPKINQVGYDLVKQAILALPQQLLSRRGSADQSKTEQEYRLTMNQLHEARQVRDDLILHSSTHIRIYGQEAYEEVCRQNKSRLDKLEEHTARLQEQLRAPALTLLTPLLNSVHTLGFETFWNAATIPERRIMIGAVIDRLTLVEPSGRYIKEVIVYPQDWLAEYVSLPERVTMPLRVAKR